MWRSALAVGMALGFVGLVRKALLVVTVDGYSMSPTLRHGDRVLAVRTGFGFRPHRKAIVVTRPPSGPTSVPPPGRLLVKRVAAVAGDPDPMGAVPAIPPGTLFIVGDSVHSVDSRDFGPIPQELVIGVVVRKLSTKEETASARAPSSEGRLPGG